jgi:hypothetical protein
MARFDLWLPRQTTEGTRRPKDATGNAIVYTIAAAVTPAGQKESALDCRSQVL